MKKDCIIIGGGVAGLTAAITLAKMGYKPLVLEAGAYPGHRICGEFFSPESLPILNQMGIQFNQLIDQALFISSGESIAFKLGKQAGSQSRFDFDMKLLSLARDLGCEVLTESSVIDIKYNPGVKLGAETLNFYQVVLNDGRAFIAKHLMIGTGKIPSLKAKFQAPLVYTGFKRHFSGIRLEKSIEMHCFDGGYVGLSSISNDSINVTCLVCRDKVVDRAGFMDDLMQRKGMEAFKERLDQGKPLFDSWLSGDVPEFGIRQHPIMPNVYWIGDAAGSIPPICGDGLGMAITTGVMAAEYMAKGQDVKFATDWVKRYQKRIFFGKCLHQLMIRPIFCKAVTYCCYLFPTIPEKLFRITRE